MVVATAMTEAKASDAKSLFFMGCWDLVFLGFCEMTRSRN